jgi:ankyrin repeat protein
MWWMFACLEWSCDFQADGMMNGQILDTGAETTPLTEHFVQPLLEADWDRVLRSLQEEIRQDPSSLSTPDIQALQAALAQLDLPTTVSRAPLWPRRFLFQHLLSKFPETLVMENTGTKRPLLFSCIRTNDPYIFELCLQTAELCSIALKHRAGSFENALDFAIQENADEFIKMWLRLQHMKGDTSVKADLSLKDLLTHSAKSRPNLLLLALEHTREKTFQDLLALGIGSREDALKTLIHENNTAATAKLLSAWKAFEKRVLIEEDLWCDAIKQNSSELLTHLLDTGQSHRLPRDLLHQAIEVGANQSLSILLSRSPHLLRAKDRYGFLPLHAAIKKGKLSLMKQLEASDPLFFQEALTLRVGEVMGPRENLSFDAFTLAILWNRHELLNFCWQMASKENLSATFFSRLLCTAIKYKALEAFQTLLEADPLQSKLFFSLGKGVDSVLSSIIRHHGRDFLNMLAKDPRFSDTLFLEMKQKNELFAWILKTGNKEAFELLVSKTGPQPWLEQNALETSWRQGYFDLFRSLANRLEPKKKRLEAFQKKHPFFLFDLLKARTDDLVAPLKPFLESNPEALNRALQETYPEIPWEGDTFIHRLVTSGQAPHVALLKHLCQLEGGKQALRVRNHQGHLPIHIATRDHHKEALKLILEADPSPSTVIFEETLIGQTSFHYVLANLLSHKEVDASLLSLLLSYDSKKEAFKRTGKRSEARNLIEYFTWFTNPRLASTRAFEEMWKHQEFWPSSFLFEEDFFSFLLHHRKEHLMLEIFDRYPENLAKHEAFLRSQTGTASGR